MNMDVFLTWSKISSFPWTRLLKKKADEFQPLPNLSVWDDIKWYNKVE